MALQAELKALEERTKTNGKQLAIHCEPVFHLALLLSLQKDLPRILGRRRYCEYTQGR